MAFYANAHCVLKVNVKCDACKNKLMNILTSICGVYTVNIDAEKGLAEIEGQVDPNGLLRELARSGEHAELVHVTLRHPALAQRSTSSSRDSYNSYYNENRDNDYGGMIEDGYGRLLSNQPDNIRTNHNNYSNGYYYALPQVSTTNNNYNSTRNDYAQPQATYVPPLPPPEYNFCEDQTLNSCTLM